MRRLLFILVILAAILPANATGLLTTNYSAAWTALSASATGASGTSYSVSGQYKVVGQVLYYVLQVTLNSGTASGAVTVTGLPFSTTAAFIVPSSGRSSDGFALAIGTNANNNNLYVTRYDGGTPVAPFVISGFYPIATQGGQN